MSEAGGAEVGLIRLWEDCSFAEQMLAAKQVRVEVV